jgi:hypothetical protein
VGLVHGRAPGGKARQAQLLFAGGVWTGWQGSAGARICLARLKDVDAARRALAVHRAPCSWATVFTVDGAHQGAPRVVTVDLDPEGLDPSGNGRPRVELTA